MVRLAQQNTSSMYEEAPTQATELGVLHHNPGEDVESSERNMKHHTNDIHDYEHNLFSCSVSPPIFTNADDINANLFNANITAFLCEWIPATMQVFGHIGSPIFAREFWSSQIRTELDHRLWREEFLGREATEVELDWLVENAMRIYWARIEEILHHHQASGMRPKSMKLESNRQVVTEFERHESVQKGKNMRRAIEVENMLSYMSIEDEVAKEELQTEKDVHMKLEDGCGWEDLEYEMREDTAPLRGQNRIEQKRTNMAWARYREMSVAVEGADREREGRPGDVNKVQARRGKYLLLRSEMGST
jgi:hypothetical protein